MQYLTIRVLGNFSCFCCRLLTFSNDFSESSRIKDASWAKKDFKKRQYYNFNMISKFRGGLKSLLRHGLSEPEFYGDLVYKGPRTVSESICPNFDSLWLV